MPVPELLAQADTPLYCTLRASPNCLVCKFCTFPNRRLALHRLAGHMNNHRDIFFKDIPALPTSQVYRKIQNAC